MAGIFHCGNNALIKVDGGVFGLTDSRSALLHWMVAGPEVARVIEALNNQQHITVVVGEG